MKKLKKPEEATNDGAGMAVPNAYRRNGNMLMFSMGCRPGARNANQYRSKEWVSVLFVMRTLGPPFFLSVFSLGLERALVLIVKKVEVLRELCDESSRSG